MEQLDRTEHELASPISQTIIAIWQKQFSPGDAYCEELNDDASKAAAAKDRWVQQFTYPNYEGYRAHDYIYFRIYGEKDVIAEGLYRKGRY